jgi:tRNA (cmo5U34)-methyltransferase
MTDEEPVDYVRPTGRWAFDAEVTRVFENMLRRSIPQYDVMRETVTNVGRRFVRPGGMVLDLGCSRGDALAPFVADNKAAICVGIDVSGPMIAEAQERFAAEIDVGRVVIAAMDLRASYPETVTADLTLAVLTVQFTPIEYRSRLLTRIFEHTMPGGALILVEKVLGESATTDALLVDEYYRLKATNGYTQDDIERKRLSLEGVLVPVTAKWNEEMLHVAGFREVECLWRWMNFAAWVAIRTA